MSELKPCPFCGGEASVYNDSNGEWVECDKCGGKGCGSGWGDCNNVFIKNWNNRAEFSTIDGKQLISEKAIAFLHDNHPEIYSKFYGLV